MRGFNVHHACLRVGIGQNLGVHFVFYLADLLVADRAGVGEVEAGALVIHQTAFLLHMRAQHFAQSLVHQMRGRVVAYSCSAQRGVHQRFHAVAHFQTALGQLAVVTEHIGFDLERVFHRKHRSAAADAALVADLAAALGVKRCVVQHHHTGLPGLHLLYGHAVHIQSRDLGFGA